MQKENEATPAQLLGQEFDKIKTDYMARLDQEIREAEAFIEKLRNQENQRLK